MIYDDAVPLEILKLLNICVLTQNSDGTLKVLGRSPTWLNYMLPECLNNIDNYAFTTNSLVLSHFLEEVKEFWDRGEDGSIEHDLWVDRIYGGDDDVIAMVAEAILNGDHRFLILRNKTRYYHKQFEVLQHVREQLLNQEWLENEVDARTHQYLKSHQEVSARIISAIEPYHGKSENHIKRVGAIAGFIADELQWKQKEVDTLVTAAHMHDIGNLKIALDLLTKSGPLSPEEFAIVKEHTVLGAEILEGSELPLLKMARDVVLFHHENWDGSGYPNGLKGEEIPIAARIVKVADVFDSLITNQVYRTAFTIDKAREIILDGAGAQFDPLIVDSFLANIDSIMDSLDERS